MSQSVAYLQLQSVRYLTCIVQRSEIKPALTRNSVGWGGVLGRGLSGVTRRTATGPSEAGLSPAAALAHVPGMGKGRVAYEKSWAWRIVFLALGAGRTDGSAASVHSYRVLSAREVAQAMEDEGKKVGRGSCGTVSIVSTPGATRRNCGTRSGAPVHNGDQADHTDIYHYQHSLAGWLAGTDGRGQLAR